MTPQTSRYADAIPEEPPAPAQLLDQLMAVRAAMVEDHAVTRALVEGVHPSYRQSAENLVHYLALRRHDLRSLQLQLAAMGLSSLGRAESCALATVDAVTGTLRQLAGRRRQTTEHNAEHNADHKAASTIDFGTGHRLLEEHTEALLGRARSSRQVRIMVTMPTEAGVDSALVRDLLLEGMDCMRINCAHDDATVWRGMIENLRRAERELGRSCKVAMDLAGPKLRTGPLEPGPGVLRIRPRRDVYGRVSSAARVWLAVEGGDELPPEPADASLALPPAFVNALSAGDKIRFTDSRGARRSLSVVEVTPNGAWGEATHTSYLVPGIRLRVPRAEGSPPLVARLGEIPARESALTLNPGDLLLVTPNLNPGCAAACGPDGVVTAFARIGCTIPEVFSSVHPGQPIWFDDGAIGGTVEDVSSEGLLVRVERTQVGGAKLRADKGINLPETHLPLAALTSKDLEDLTFVARHADIVQLSFANTAQDVEDLQRKLTELGGRMPGIVLKIETQRGFENLPAMLLTAMRWPSCGVMIARGDLAVECGFERLAEVQEEILWICEAAHAPAIWATQVLESLTKQGMPSRAEITDAAMGNRAECVMLNKGPHVVRSVRVLDDILRRMEPHQAKKRAMLRHLRLADGWGD